MTNPYRLTNKPGQRDASSKPRLPIAGRKPDQTPKRGDAPAAAIRGLSRAEIREIVRDLLG